MPRPSATTRERHAAATAVEAARARLLAVVEAGENPAPARAALAAARAALAQADAAIERAHRASELVRCAAAADLYERARDVHDWAERAAEFRRLEEEHAARIVDIDAGRPAPTSPQPD